MLVVVYAVNMFTHTVYLQDPHACASSPDLPVYCISEADCIFFYLSTLQPPPCSALLSSGV